MAYTYESMETIVPNAVMRKAYNNGVFKTYRIKPNVGYVLHDNAYDFLTFVPELDENGNEVYDESGMPVGTDVITLGYRPTEGSVGYNYDWTPTEMLDEAGNTVTAYGSRQFFCKPIDEVPENQIFGVVTPQPEIM